MIITGVLALQQVTSAFLSPAAALVSAASAAAAVCVFAPFAVSVAGASAPSAASSLHWHSAAPAAGAPAPASAAVSVGPASCLSTASAAVAGISGPSSRSRYWAASGLVRWKFASMDCAAGGRGTLFSGRACCRVARRVIWRPCLFGWHDGAVVKCSRLGSSRDWRLALVHGSTQLRLVRAACTC